MDKNADPQLEEMVSLTQRAEKGDETALPDLRKLLQAPKAVELLGGNLARQAQLTLIAKFTGKNLLVRESLTQKLELLRAELTGPTPSVLERLLVDRVVTCWLHLHHLEQQYAQKDSMTLELGMYYQRCLTLAQKRYVSAIKSLALVRKLAVPILQLNIAKRQVNVAGNSAAANAERKS